MPSEFSYGASALAFYGLQLSAARAEASYRHLVDWFDSLGFHPDNLAVSGAGFSEDYDGFEGVDRHLRQSGFEGVRGFSVCRLAPGRAIPVQNWRVDADVSEEYSCCTVGARCSIAPIPGEAILSVARTIVQDLAPVYGIGYRREMGLGPTFYGMGQSVGLNLWGNDRAKAVRINRWNSVGMGRRVYEKGLLRDVYPWNFLTEPHLSRQVEGVSLRQWIGQGKGRGSLTSVGGDMWLWAVQEYQIERVRRAMEGAGMVFDVGPAGGSPRPSGP